MSIIIFLLYTTVCFLVLYRLSLRPGFLLNYKQVWLAFAVKIIAGGVFGYFYLHYYNGGDTWLYHQQSLKEYALLKSNPSGFFFNDIFPQDYDSNQLYTVFDSNTSYIKDLEYTLLIKLFAIFNLLSGGRYYVNVIFYNALVFWGSYCLFKSLALKYPAKKMTWFICIFFFPPLIFWTSGLLKDGLCFGLCCGLFYQLFILFERKISLKRVLYAFILFLLIFLLRNYLALSFLVIIPAYAFSMFLPKNSLIIFLTIIFLAVIAFFVTPKFGSSFNLPQKMADRQYAFFALSGNSFMPIDSLHDNIGSYTSILPTALNHVFLRPYPTESKGPLYLFSFLEILFVGFLLIRAIFKPADDWKKVFHDPLMLSFLLFAVSNYLIIGYTVPFLGAIARYKVMFEIFLVISLLRLQRIDLFFITVLDKKKAV